MLKKLLLLVAILSLGLLMACSSETGGESSSEEVKKLKLAHNLSEDHPIHTALTSFAEDIEEKTDGSITFEIFSNGVLGSEQEVLEQMQSGSVDVTKVSAGALESFSDDYSVFSLPYIFTSEEHYRNVMESDVVEEIYQSTEDNNFIGLSYFDSGARSFYTKDTPVETPEDLDGLLIRVMDSPTAIEMIELLGGTPTPLAYGEVYTALQQGVIDGAESNPTALTTGQHGEVSKAFSYTEHTNIPDIVVIRKDIWDSFSDEEKQIFEETANEARVEHTDLWNKAIEEAVTEAEGMGVEFYDVDKEPFIELVQPLHDKYSENERLGELIERINELDK
ncbi:TRAP transporter substrate-binding protein [Oceanobacillus piezotolerans]|uniref:TRAP transporter substrate-binding protein n=1 Tax=Oceanobacillus piezotolerans TaxID=2448030 RepID=A0A498DRL3_9BACI|nr:TRAP transporter substrate-binding protein [Oceanobacillus piezotolerans]RLL47089.1 TRAP transporter substrate-binding protein [Oceanobacillus piezotolerans]